MIFVRSPVVRADRLKGFTSSGHSSLCFFSSSDSHPAVCLLRNKSKQMFLYFYRESGAALGPAGDRAPRGGTLLLRVCRHPLRRQRGAAGSIPGGHGGNSASRAGALSQTERGLGRPGPGPHHRPKQQTGFAHVAEKLRPAPDQPIPGHTAHTSPQQPLQSSSGDAERPL